MADYLFHIFYLQCVTPKLQSGEKLICQLRPHPLAFYHLYLIWIYLAMVGAFFMTDPMIEIQQFSLETAKDLSWWGAILVPGVIIALLRIDWRWFVTLLLSGVVAFFSPEFIDVADPNQILIIFGLLGILGTEAYRRGHSYYITSRRLILESGYFGVRRRTLLYQKIDDLAVEQPILGRIFNFGSIIPITGSGFGLGTDFSIAGATFGLGPAMGGGKAIKTPRLQSFHQMDGVRDPNSVSEEIISMMYGEE
jgi:hypothetical protein